MKKKKKCQVKEGQVSDKGFSYVIFFFFFFSSSYMKQKQEGKL